MKVTLTLLPELFIVVLSFLFISLSFSPAVNSDDALTVLMTHQYNFPDAIYCWQQDRGGTIVPLIGQLFYKIFHLSPMLSADIARYLILILGFISYRSFLRKQSSKITLALLYFLPPYIFISFTQYSWGLMYSIIGCSLFVINYLIKTNSKKRKIIGLSVLLLLTILATWTMDQAYVIYLYLSALFIFYHRKDKIKRGQYAFISIVILLLCGIAIYFLKTTAVVKSNSAYELQAVNSINEILNAFLNIGKISYQTLFFQSSNDYYSLYTFLILLISIYTFKKCLEKPLTDRQNFIFWGIIALSFGLLFLVTSNHWVLLNGFSRRYYSGFYFLFIGGILYFWDQLSDKRSKINWILMLSMIIGFASSIYLYKYESPKTLIPRTEKLQGFNQLDGSIGVIGDFWYSYGISYINPDKIIATPPEGHQIRNPKYIQKVFKQDHLYLVKNLWLDEFPDEIQQYGHLLIKKGSEMQISEVEIQEYEVKKLQ